MCIKNCAVCPNLIAVTAVTVGAENVALTIPTQTLLNRQRICLYSPIAIPSSTLPVVLTDGTTTIQLITPCGNAVRADQMRTRRIYFAYVATDTNLAVVRNTLCATAYVAPQITGVAATDAAAGVAADAVGA